MPIRAGRVTSFEEDRGLGTVTAPDGATWPFHCTAIAGGTRSIDVGVEVLFETAAGPDGRWWATCVTALRRLTTVRTAGTSTWDREEIYGDAGR